MSARPSEDWPADTTPAERAESNGSLPTGTMPAGVVALPTGALDVGRVAGSEPRVRTSCDSLLRTLSMRRALAACTETLRWTSDCPVAVSFTERLKRFV